MKIAFITRATLYRSPGGDTIQVQQLCNHLNQKGIEAQIFLTHEKIDYPYWDLFHFSNITRPADILFHIEKTGKPFILSPQLIDYSEYDRNFRKGLTGLLLRLLPADMNEYMKTIARWASGTDKLQSKQYLWKGHTSSVRYILKRAKQIMPGSENEYQALCEKYLVEKEYTVVPNGIDPSLFCPDKLVEKDSKIVICAARIEGIKNQLNLIRALNNTSYTLMLVGSPAPNQKKYYEECRKLAASNIIFHDQVTQRKLINYYHSAKVHALPSWFETCGLSSLEAAAMGCNIVITDKGYTREYFGDHGFYCNPSDPISIYNAVEKAAESDCSTALQQRIAFQYTWQKAASITINACKNIIRA